MHHQLARIEVTCKKMEQRFLKEAKAPPTHGYLFARRLTVRHHQPNTDVVLAIPLFCAARPEVL